MVVDASVYHFFDSPMIVANSSLKPEIKPFDLSYDPFDRTINDMSFNQQSVQRSNEQSMNDSDDTKESSIEDYDFDMKIGDDRFRALHRPSGRKVLITRRMLYNFTLEQNETLRHEIRLHQSVEQYLSEALQQPILDVFTTTTQTVDETTNQTVVCLFVVTDWPSSGDLQSYIDHLRSFSDPNQRFIDERRIWYIFLCLAAKLEALHTRGVVHGDVATTAIFLHQPEANQSIIESINQSNNQSSDQQISEDEFCHVTLANLTFCTVINQPCYQGDSSKPVVEQFRPANVSPEYLCGSPLTYLSDLFQLACVMYELATLNHPFDESLKNRSFSRSINQSVSQRIVSGRCPLIDGPYSRQFKDLILALIDQARLDRRYQSINQSLNQVLNNGFMDASCVVETCRFMISQLDHLNNQPVTSSTSQSVYQTMDGTIHELSGEEIDDLSDDVCPRTPTHQLVDPLIFEYNQSIRNQSDNPLNEFEFVKEIYRSPPTSPIKSTIFQAIRLPPNRTANRSLNRAIGQSMHLAIKVIDIYQPNNEQNRSSYHSNTQSFQSTKTFSPMLGSVPCSPLSVTHSPLMKSTSQPFGYSGNLSVSHSANQPTNQTANQTINESHALNEALILHEIDHPNVIKQYDCFEFDQKLYLCLEYANIGDLNQLIDAARSSGVCFTEAQIWKFLGDIAKGVQCLHRRQLLHRDLKPANIFVTDPSLIQPVEQSADDMINNAENFVLKVGDLGLSCPVDASLSDSRMDQGTPLYVSPEIMVNQSYSFASDIWALGIIAYELSALKRPFDVAGHQGHENPAYLLRHKIGRGQYEDLPQCLSLALKELIAGMLDLMPMRRPSIDEICHIVDTANMCVQLGHLPKCRVSELPVFFASISRMEV